MSMDIARVGVAVDTSGIKTGTEALKQLKEAASGVDTAVEQVSQALTEATAGAKSLAGAAAQTSNVFSTLEGRGARVSRTLDQMRTATAAVVRAEERLNALKDSGTATAAQMVSAETRLTVARRQLTEATQKATAAASGFDSELAKSGELAARATKEFAMLEKAQRSLTGAMNKAADATMDAAQMKRLIAERTADVARAQAAYDAVLKQNTVNQGLAAQAVQNVEAALERQTQAARQAAAGMVQATEAVEQFQLQTKDATGAIRANTGNIAAQFQDIGVTAAMGMNPLMIGLQQGTQMSAVFAQTGRSMGETLRSAFEMILEPQALLTIGLVALVAAGIQMVDWAGVGTAAMHGFADVLDLVADNMGLVTVGVTILAGALIALNAGAVAGMIVGMGKLLFITTLLIAELALLGLAFMLTNPIGIAITAVLALAGMFIFLGDESTNASEDMDTVGERAMWLGNLIVNSIIGAVRVVGATISLLPRLIDDAITAMGNNIRSGIASIINWVSGKLTELRDTIRAAANDPLMQMAPAWVRNGLNAAAGVIPQIGTVTAPAARPTSGALGEIGASASAVWNDQMGERPLQDAANWISGAADRMRRSPPGEEEKTRAARTSRAGGTERDPYGDLLTRTRQEIAALKARNAVLGQSEDAMAQFDNRQRLLGDMQRQNVRLTREQTAELNKLADALTEQQLIQRDREAMVEIERDAQRRLELIQSETRLLGLHGHQLLFMTHYQELYNAAKAKGVRITADEIAKMKELAQQLATADRALGTSSFVDRIMRDSQLDSDRRDDELGLVGLTGEARATAEARVRLRDRARAGGVDLTDPNVVGAIDAAARAEGSETMRNRRADFMGQNQRDHDERMRQLEDERGAIGLTGEALARYNAGKEAEARLRRENLELTPEEIAAVKARAEAEAGLQWQLEESRRTLEFYKDTTRSFFREFRDSLREGVTFWDAFRDAALNALDRIITRLADRALENFLDSMFKGGNGGFGGGTGKSGAGGGFQGIVQAGIEMLGKFFGGGRSTGGPVSPGQFYRVNEGGQEFFAPQVPGAIWNPAQLNQLRRANDNGPSQVVIPVSVGGQHLETIIYDISSQTAATAAVAGVKAAPAVVAQQQRKRIARSRRG